MTDLKQVTDKLLDTFSQSKLQPIALKVAAKYNDDAVTDRLNPAPPVVKDITRIADEQTALFASSDKAFIDSFIPSDEYKAIADEVAFEIVEEFNN